MMRRLTDSYGEPVSNGAVPTSHPLSLTSQTRLTPDYDRDRRSVSPEVARASPAPENIPLPQSRMGSLEPDDLPPLHPYPTSVPSRSRENSPVARSPSPHMRALPESTLNARASAPPSVMSWDSVREYGSPGGKTENWVRAQTERAQTEHRTWTPNAGLDLSPGFFKNWTYSKTEHALEELNNRKRVEGRDVERKQTTSSSTIDEESEEEEGDEEGTLDHEEHQDVDPLRYTSDGGIGALNDDFKPPNVFLNSPSPSALSPSRRRLRKRTRRPSSSIASEYASELHSQFASLLLRLKRPIISLLLLSLLMFIFTLLLAGYSYLVPSSPLAVVVPYLAGYPQGYYYSNGYDHNADFKELMQIEASFERVVENSADGRELAASLKESQMAISDLSTLVRYSELGCKEPLSRKLERFAAEASASTMALLKFSAQVGGVLERLLSINEAALRELRLLSNTRPSLLPPYLSLFLTGHRRPTMSALFTHTVSQIESQLHTLIKSAQSIQQSLITLEELHTSIYDEIQHSLVDIRRDRKAIMGSLWGQLGLHAGAIENFRENEELLETVGQYEESARGYVSTTLLQLGQMSEQMELMRGRMAEPMLAGAVGTGQGVEEAVRAVEGAVGSFLERQEEQSRRERQWREKVGRVRGLRKEEEEIRVVSGRNRVGS